MSYGKIENEWTRQDEESRAQIEYFWKQKERQEFRVKWPKLLLVALALAILGYVFTVLWMAQ